MEHELLNAIKLLFGENGELRQILGVTLKMASISTSVSFIVGTALGVLLGLNEFRFKRGILSITSTLMGFPPVLAGLVVFFILSRSGPLGEFKLLYSVTAMVCAQILIITPVMLHMSATTIGERAASIKETMQGLGLNKWKQLKYVLLENKSQLFALFFLGFGRAISEVGAAQLVGGNVQYKTRVMTTAIVLETNKGNFEMALALGVLLLIIAFIINVLSRLLQGKRK